jgi:hypothetical protein
LDGKTDGQKERNKEVSKQNKTSVLLGLGTLLYSLVQDVRTVTDVTHGVKTVLDFQTKVELKSFVTCEIVRQLDVRALKIQDSVETQRHKSRDSSVGIALGYGLDGRGSRLRFPTGAGNFSLHYRLQNGFGAHPDSYPMSTRGFLPGGEAAGA